MGAATGALGETIGHNYSGQLGLLESIGATMLVIATIWGLSDVLFNILEARHE
jgi:hypothetical protein